MARITVEDCLEKVNNRFTLIHMASQRVRQLRKGAEPSISSKNRDIVVSLREIAAGNVTTAEPVDSDFLLEDQPDMQPEQAEPEGDEQAPDDEKSEGAGTEGKQ